MSESQMPVTAAFPRVGPPPPFSADTLCGKPVPPRRWNVPGLIPGRTVTTIDGDGGTGKSTLALQLAVATALGKKWLNREVRSGPVLYLSAEDDRDELHRRLSDMCVHYDCGLEDLGNLKLWPLDDITELVELGGRGQEIEPTAFWSEFEAAARECRPVLIVLDSRADVYGADEVSRRQVRMFVSMLRKLARSLDGAIVLLSHPSLAGLSSGSGSSGSTAWSNSVRSRMYLSKPSATDNDHDPDLRLLSLKKANYGPETADMRLYRRAGVFVTQDTSSTAPRSQLEERARIDSLFLEFLGVMTERGSNVSPNPGPNYAPAMFVKQARAAGIAKSALLAAMDRLFTAGRIRIETTGSPSRPRQRLVAVSVQ